MCRIHSSYSVKVDLVPNYSQNTSAISHNFLNRLFTPHSSKLETMGIFDTKIYTYMSIFFFFEFNDHFIFCYT